MTISVIEGTIQSWRAFDHQNIQTVYASGSDACARHEGPVTAGLFDVVSRYARRRCRHDQRRVAGERRGITSPKQLR